MTDSETKALTAANEIPPETKGDAPPLPPARVERPAKTPEEVQADFLAMVPQYGNVETTPEQQAILFAPVNPHDVEIRPDGLVYLSWTVYVKRLRDAFNTRWSLMPRGNPAVRDGMIMSAFYLCIQGHVAGYAVGEAQQQGGMTYGDVLESAKSNALMRLCKGMGISLELWDPRFVREWREKFAVQDVPDPKRDGKFLWRRLRAGEIVRLVNPAPVTVAAPVPAKDLSAAVEAILDPHNRPVEGGKKGSVIMPVTSVNVHKPGGQSRQKNPVYRIILTDGATYYTFDKTLATVANEARKSGVLISVSFEATAYGLKILELKSGPFDEPLPLKDRG